MGKNEGVLASFFMGKVLILQEVWLVRLLQVMSYVATLEGVYHDE